METKTATEDLVFEDQTLRDGLQNENRIFSIEEKISLFQILADAGVKRIQIGSFVHPKWVPQMADTDELIRRLLSTEDVILTALILNRRGLERAVETGVQDVGMGVSASDAHSRRNVNQPMVEALSHVKALITESKNAGLKVL